MKKKRKTASLFKKNIPNQLHSEWKRLRRKGDVDKITITYGVSRSTINRALIWGYAPKQKTIDVINDYFKTREQQDLSDINQLKQL